MGYAIVNIQLTHKTAIPILPPQRGVLVNIIAEMAALRPFLEAAGKTL